MSKDKKSPDEAQGNDRQLLWIARRARDLKVTNDAEMKKGRTSHHLLSKSLCLFGRVWNLRFLFAQVVCAIVVLEVYCTLVCLFYVR